MRPLVTAFFVSPPNSRVPAPATATPVTAAPAACWNRSRRVTPRWTLWFFWLMSCSLDAIGVQEKEVLYSRTVRLRKIRLTAGPTARAWGARIVLATNTCSHGNTHVSRGPMGLRLNELHHLQSLDSAQEYHGKPPPPLWQVTGRPPGPGQEKTAGRQVAGPRRIQSLSKEKRYNRTTHSGWAWPPANETVTLTKCHSTSRTRTDADADAGRPLRSPACT